MYLYSVGTANSQRSKHSTGTRKTSHQLAKGWLDFLLDNVTTLHGMDLAILFALLALFYKTRRSSKQ